MIQDPQSLVFVLALCTAAAFWLERTFKWAGKIGATFLAIGLGAMLSNANLVTVSSGVYDTVFGPVTSLAIVWLLFAVNIRDIKAAGPSMLKVFGLAILGTALGAVLAGFIFQTVFPQTFWKLAGTLTGTYAGGSLNFVAVGRALDLPPALFTATAAADNVLTAAWFMATLFIPSLFFKIKHHQISEKNTSTGTPQSWNPVSAEVPMSLVSLSLLLALGLGLLQLTQWLSEVLGNVGLGWIPSILILSTLALVVGHLPAVRKLKGSFLLGYLAMHVFFVVIGISSKFSLILEVGLEVFYFTALVVLVHGLFLFAVVRWRKGNAIEASVASQAAIGGPSTALAIAISLKRPDLALPGLAVGMLGYAVGTYLGLGVAYGLKVVLIG